nr:beo protein [Human spumaretrovirus]
MDSYEKEESVASTSGIQDLQTLSELVGPENAGEGELTIAEEPEENPRRPRRYTKREVKCVSYHAYKEIEDKHPQHIKLQDWIPTPEEMTIMADFTNPRIGGEGHLAHYQAAMEAYGPQRGSNEERVWWNVTRNQGKQGGEYYREGGEEPHYPNTPAPHRRTWDERHKVLKLSSFATPSDIQRWATKALPYGWKVVTESGNDYTSRRKIRTLTEMTQDEIRKRWESGYCDPFIDSGSDSDGPF